MRLFLRANGYDTAFDDSVSWADEMIGLLEHRSTEEDFARALRPYVTAPVGIRHLIPTGRSGLMIRAEAEKTNRQFVGKCPPQLREGGSRGGD